MRTIPLMIPDLPDADAMLPYLRRIDAVRWYTNFGPLVREFEQALAKTLMAAVGRPHVVTCANATLALELALQCLSLPPGARVLIPGLTFVATATAVKRAGLMPVIADVDPRSWLLTPMIATHALSRMRIDAVLPVAAFGSPQDVAAWETWRAKFGIPVLIDAAGAFGNQNIGSVPCVFSLHATKALGIGEGGFVASSNPELIARVRRLTNFGMDGDGMVQECGSNAKLSEYHAAIGLAALAQWPGRRALRLHLQKIYLHGLAKACQAIELQLRPPGLVSTLWPVALPTTVDIESVRHALAQAGIATRQWYLPPIFAHPSFAACPTADDLPICRELAQRLLGLPFHLQLTETDIDHICTTLANALGMPLPAQIAINDANAAHAPMASGMLGQK